jgi:biopolymer transport protein ExbB
VALLLLGMSLASWMVILIKALDIMQATKNGRAGRLLAQRRLCRRVDQLGSDPSNPFRQLALEGREATAHHRNTKAHLHDSLDVSDWVTRCLRNCIDEFTARLQNGLAILASVGSTAPFVGLFGTVWGIYHALLAIGTVGPVHHRQGGRPHWRGAHHDRPGPGRGHSGGAGLQRAGARQQVHVLTKLNSFAHDLHAYFVTGARVNAGNTNRTGNVLPMKKGS